MYYLQGRPDAQPRQFTSTYPVPPLTTNADFAAVVKSQFLPDTIMPADIARLALFLAADDSRMITKQTFNVNGGRA